MSIVNSKFEVIALNSQSTSVEQFLRRLSVSVITFAAYIL